MPQTVTLPKTEYQRLRRTANLLEVIRKPFEAEEDFFIEPPVKDQKKSLKNLKKLVFTANPS